MNHFEIYRPSLFQLYSNSITSSEQSKHLSQQELESLVNKSLDNRIKDYNEELTWKNMKDSVSFFDLVEGEIYYLLSGFNHYYFKVVEKSPSQYEGLPYYQVKIVKTLSVSNFDDNSYYEELRGMSNSMIFSRYKHIKAHEYIVHKIVQ